VEIGIGLPNAVPGTEGKQLTDWARESDPAGFSTLGTIDRIAFPTYEPIVALSAAAAVTRRIRLATTVMLGPLRANPALVAKQALSLDALAGGGRVVLGIGVGGREDDYRISGLPMSRRGAWLDAALERIRQIWRGEGGDAASLSPLPQGEGPSLLIGGGADAAFERAARHADGWIMGAGTPDGFAEAIPKLEAAWHRQGRDGEPRRASLAYFCLGEDAERRARSYLTGYYGWLGEELSGMIAGAAATDAEGVRGAMAAFEAAGCRELIFMPCSGDPGQVGLLAEAAGL
jgi:alkanesulfonate monooxygenase SsuD/methylene tetrahydromethanopterin reductase-like flavin-dependent oxidoreductase (luciferase family)